ncbi:MAG: Lrp/AsnC ligand binding domain-containing protein [Parachlamydiaceae bacterium]
MVSALVLVNTDLGVEGEVLESLKGLEGVEEAHSLYGVYDLAIKIKAISMDKLRVIIGSIRFRIKQASGVSSLLTLMMVE